MSFDKYYLVALKFAKEVLRTPIKDIPKIPFLVEFWKTRSDSFMFGDIVPTMPPLIEKKGISTIGIDYLNDDGKYNIWIGYRSTLFKIEGRFEGKVDTILKYYDLMRAKNNLTGMYFRGDAKYWNFEVYDDLFEVGHKTILELSYLDLKLPF